MSNNDWDAYQEWQRQQHAAEPKKFESHEDFMTALKDPRYKNSPSYLKSMAEAVHATPDGVLQINCSDGGRTVHKADADKAGGGW